MYVCSICIAEKEIRLCKNIAIFLQNLPFQLAKFEGFFFCVCVQKTAGTKLNTTVTGVSSYSVIKEKKPPTEIV